MKGASTETGRILSGLRPVAVLALQDSNHLRASATDDVDPPVRDDAPELAHSPKHLRQVSFDLVPVHEPSTEKNDEHNKKGTCATLTA